MVPHGLEKHDIRLISQCDVVKRVAKEVELDQGLTLSILVSRITWRGAGGFLEFAGVDPVAVYLENGGVSLGQSYDPFLSL